ncbi:hypothetical protein FZEAL_4538 [Fusarium zealandicum]|uniref:Uncharacterized protein n=1 Tax=Fusarium zealandicum TaxID=1053134 RepID=A0A8H4UM20_9HYPO|nr:hypothetical protein FZEAL_4538 [Fusarium zealandicum]
MSHPTKDSKRMLSPQLNTIKTKTKRPRAIYVMESPGGTMRETDPSNYHPPASGLTASGLTASDQPANGQQPRGQPIPVQPDTRQLENVPLPTRGAQPRNVINDLSQESLSALSVRDKLRKGISMGMANMYAYDRAGRGMAQYNPRLAPQPRPEPEGALTVTGMMKKLDVAAHIDPNIRLDPSIVASGPATISDELTDKRPGAGDPPDVQEKKIEHFRTRMSALYTACQRLQAVTGSANYHRFSPTTALPHLEPGLVMLVQDYGCSGNPLKMNDIPANMPGLMASLWGSSRRNGYRKLDLNKITFKRNWEEDRLVEQSMPSFPPSRKCNEPEELFSLDAHQGSLTLYETKVAYGPGKWQKWTWFKICKPLIDVKGPRPVELTSVPESVLVFGIPTSQIEKAPQQPGQPARLGDFGRLNLGAYAESAKRSVIIEWKFSKNGIPSFEVSAQPEHLEEKDLAPDMLWVDCAPYYKGGEAWWEDIQDLALNNRAFWELVQQHMASFLCLVEVKSKYGATWIEVAPEAQGSSNSERDSGSGMRGGRMGRGESGLRNEVRQG